MAAPECRQAEEIRDTFCVAKDPANGEALVAALGNLGFSLTKEQAAEIVQGKDFV